jgi:photosystem II stability/assembly factor-like uncharacterized protein
MHPKIIISVLLLLIGYCEAVAAEANPAGTNTETLREIHMLTARAGWALAYRSNFPRILRTTSGGESWQDVTPNPISEDQWQCEFPNPKTAWLSTTSGLSRTTNGGKTWTNAAAPKFYFSDGAQCRWLDAHRGVACEADFGAGNAYYNFFDTRDGGLTWQPVMIIPPAAYADRSARPGTIHLCNLCCDRIGYYPPGKVIIVAGDMGDEAPKGVVRLRLSRDLKSWRDLRLPLPEKFRRGLVEPSTPVFFDQQRALLPVQILAETNDFPGFSALLFYATEDGGETWAARTAPPGLRNSGYHLAMVSARDIFVCDDNGLLASHDGARTWRVFKPNIDFGRRDSRRYVSQLDFADATHGWIVIADSTRIYPDSEFFLYRTTNGGKTWRELPLKTLR